MVNRDIKLENTLLQMIPNLPLPLLKICDFGYSKAHFMSAPKSKVGTLAYMAPEVIKTTGNYDGKLADIWSCGVMLYVMLFGQYPFEAVHQGQVANTQRVQTMMNRILQMQWSIPGNVDISDDCRDLLSRMMVADPGSRLSMQQIQRHPWFVANLPPDALLMNENFLHNTDYSGVQTVEAIQDIIRTAQTPGPGKYNFNTGEEETYTDLIDDAIQDEMETHTHSFDVGRVTQQQQQPAQQGPGAPLPPPLPPPPPPQQQQKVG